MENLQVGTVKRNLPTKVSKVWIERLFDDYSNSRFWQRLFQEHKADFEDFNEAEFELTASRITVINEEIPEQCLNAYLDLGFNTCANIYETIDGLCDYSDEFGYYPNSTIESIGKQGVDEWASECYEDIFKYIEKYDYKKMYRDYLNGCDEGSLEHIVGEAYELYIDRLKNYIEYNGAVYKFPRDWFN